MYRLIPCSSVSPMTDLLEVEVEVHIITYCTTVLQYILVCATFLSLTVSLCSANSRLSCVTCLNIHLYVTIHSRMAARGQTTGSIQWSLNSIAQTYTHKTSSLWKVSCYTIHTCILWSMDKHNRRKESCSSGTLRVFVGLFVP